jgi:hypothetical protein
MNTRTEQLIESWFANSLSEAEGTELRQLLAKDPTAAAEFAWQQSLAGAVRTGGLGNDSLNIKLSELERRFRFRRVILQVAAVAAAFTTLIVAIWLINPFSPQHREDQITATGDTLQNPGFIPQVTAPPQNPPSTTELSPQKKMKQDEMQAKEALQRQQEENRKKRLLRDSIQEEVVANFQHFKNISKYNAAGGVEEDKKMVMNAFALYNEAAEKIEPAEKQAAYKKTIQAFKPIVETDSGNVENRFYYGVALLGDKQFPAAAEAFEQVTEKQGKYQIPAKFYLGMALSGAEQYKAGRKAFQDYLDAPSNNRQFKDLAEKMLKKLPQ